jgi:hypothetical protein
MSDFDNFFFKSINKKKKNMQSIAINFKNI